MKGHEVHASFKVESTTKIFTLICAVDWFIDILKVKSDYEIKLWSFQVSGPVSVHVYSFSFENATFSLRIQLSSTSIQKNDHQKRSFLKMLSRGNLFKISVYLCSCNERKRKFSKTQVFENADFTPPAPVL